MIERIKKIGIIGAMAQEIRVIKEHLVIAGTDNIAGFTFISGSLNGKLVVLTVSSIGKVNAAVCTQLMIDHFHVDCVINTGIAGSLNAELRMCDVVISEDTTYHDVRQEQMISCFPNRESFYADQRLVNYAVHACDLTRSENWNYIVGRILTGESFVADDRVKKKIVKQYGGDCIEMEGAAIAHTAYLNRIPFVIIRCISDKADSAANFDYTTFEKVAANISAQIVVQMIRLMAEY